ncbi:hypothetical protein EMPS_03015 [Entomortierella parvispora]|uniref:Uncharacterized protein n=1 Tax=Entomortierella parvispora TaxID=205924 RepID=A0A9P3H5V2_9FUNG|nr:hypothetical protein EMPS_03015 [Entomortierella parvispora]
MAAQSRKHSAVTFLQPNTVLSSRASIFGDSNSGYANNQPIHKGAKKGRTSSKSNRFDQDDDHSQNDSEEDHKDVSDEEDAYSKAILERLYGKLAGEIEIKDASTSKGVRSSTEDSSDNSVSSTVDNKLSIFNSGSNMGETTEAGQEEEEQMMEFRLFATSDDKDDTPTSIVVLNPKAPVEVYVHHDREDLDESAGSERMRQIFASAIDAKTILDQAAIPWARSFFAHKVIHVPLHQKESKSPARKSKRKREFEKKVKAGLISPSELASTARKVKVSESWGKPFIMRKGLDRKTIDPGTAPVPGSGGRGRGRGRGRGSLRGERGSLRGGRGGRGGGRGGSSMSARAESEGVKKVSVDISPDSSTTPAKRHGSDSGTRYSTIIPIVAGTNNIDQES